MPGRILILITLSMHPSTCLENESLIIKGKSNCERYYQESIKKGKTGSGIRTAGRFGFTRKRLLLFVEKNSLASIMKPISKILTHNIVRVNIDAQDFHFESEDQTEFEWQIFLIHNSLSNKSVIQVESEYLSDRHQLELTSYYQFNSDAQGMALFNLRTHQSDQEFMINSVNLTDQNLEITGYNKINGTIIKNQRIILKNHTTAGKLEYPVTKSCLRECSR